MSLGFKRLKQDSGTRTRTEHHNTISVIYFLKLKTSDAKLFLFKKNRRQPSMAQLCYLKQSKLIALTVTDCLLK